MPEPELKGRDSSYGATIGLAALAAVLIIPPPAGMPHYLFAAEKTIVQIYGTGPFDVLYVDPKDDPRKK